MMEPKEQKMSSWVKLPFEDFFASSPLKKQRIEDRHSPVPPLCNTLKPVPKKSNKNDSSWLEKFKPSKREELVINAKKIDEVDNWLKCIDCNGGTRILLLTGPPGSGKTITLQVLCKERCFQLIEWITPLDVNFESGANGESLYRSPVAVFDDFLVRAGRYSNVLLSASTNRTKKIVLVKDFPNIFLHDHAMFHQVIRKHSQQNRMLIVFICSDIDITRRLFPDDLKTDAKILTINFNPIVQRSLMKALNRVLDHLQKEGTIVVPQEKKSEICDSCNGDLRSAILRLQFDSVKGSFIKQSILLKKSYLKVGKSGCTKPTLISLSDKDEKLDLFRGLGRVLYPKIEHSVTGKASFNCATSRAKFLHDPDSIVEMFLSQPNSFIAFLQENYLSTFSNITDVSKAALRLANTDLLMCRWWERESVQHFGLALAVRGLMTANRTPLRSWRPIVKPCHYVAEVTKKEFSELGKNLFTESNATAKDILLDVLPLCRYIPNEYTLPQKQLLIKFAL